MRKGRIPKEVCIYRGETFYTSMWEVKELCKELLVDIMGEEIVSVPLKMVKKADEEVRAMYV